ncbi:efflux RND transporter periplasmic adaptor subunit [Nibricoccus sp. IMCC34717]|uniref:efflux RND transporter periplasmic adaptor subunit n=1 Tax=Nibricoccus sp. IMCC34717 TaxID=3034021 RepID=UPI00384C4443
MTEVAKTPTSGSRRKKSRKKWYILGAVVLLIGIGIASRKKGPPPTMVTVEKAEVRNLTQVVSATGKIQPETEVKIFSEVAGEITELPFRDGDQVKKGDLLASIRPDFYRFQVEQMTAEFASMKAVAAQVRVRLVKAEEDLKRSEALFAQKLISDSDITAARAVFAQEQANVESAEANIQRVSGQLSQSKDNLAKTRIYAPIDGRITSRTSELGERVVATGQFTGTEMMRVADLTNMEVRVNINENDIVNVKVGDRARIAIDAFPRRAVVGVVKEIGSAARTTGLNTQEEVTNFQVKIRITDKDLALRPGMSATVDIETKSVENVVSVPLQAVTVRARETNKTVDQLSQDRSAQADAAKGSGDAAAVNDKQKQRRERTDRESLQRVVFVFKDGKVKMMPVETGIADLNHIEITSGIQKEDTVVSGNYAVITRVLTDGMDVKVDPGLPAPKKP